MAILVSPLLQHSSWVRPGQEAQLLLACQCRAFSIEVVTPVSNLPNRRNKPGQRTGYRRQSRRLLLWIHCAFLAWQGLVQSCCGDNSRGKTDSLPNIVII